MISIRLHIFPDIIKKFNLNGILLANYEERSISQRNNSWQINATKQRLLQLKRILYDTVTAFLVCHAFLCEISHFTAALLKRDSNVYSYDNGTKKLILHFLAAIIYSLGAWKSGVSSKQLEHRFLYQFHLVWSATCKNNQSNIALLCSLSFNRCNRTIHGRYSLILPTNVIERIVRILTHSSYVYTINIPQND